MNSTIIAVAGCACLVGVGARIHHCQKKRWERRCSKCESLEVVRIIRAYPVTRKGVNGVPENKLVGKDMLFAVFKFTYCRRCRKMVHFERHDKIFTLASLRHKAHWEPESFKHNAQAFLDARIQPGDLNLSFDPWATLGEANLAEVLGLTW